MTSFVFVRTVVEQEKEPILLCRVYGKTATAQWLLCTLEARGHVD